MYYNMTGKQRLGAGSGRLLRRGLGNYCLLRRKRDRVRFGLDATDLRRLLRDSHLPLYHPDN